MSDFYGTNGNDTLQGGIGGDRIYGYAQGADPDLETGNDELHGGDGRDTIYGGGGNDILYGDALNDSLYGQMGDDQLYGGSGDDYLDGGDGNDTFWLGGSSSGNDTFRGGTGTDIVRLYDNLERGRLTLDAATSIETLDLGGFQLIGTVGSDIYDLSGLTALINFTGTILLGADNDIFTGHQGVDVVSGGTANDTLHGGGGNDVLTGDSGRDLLDGGDGDDLFWIGDIDTDTFIGGAGIDTIRLMNATERQTLAVTAASGVEILDTNGYRLKGSTGNDSFDLSGLSTLTLGKAPIDLQSGNDVYVGFSGKDNVAGGAGSDRLDTGAGNDRLDGGGGADELTGGSGLDSFVFSVKPFDRSDFDVIVDFNTVDDRLLIDNRAFSAVGRDGALSKAAFVANMSGKAQDSSDRLIYETDTGELYYDSNGSKKGGSVLIAEFEPDLTLRASDFFVI